ncbi:alpha/beta hydrolase family protein [Pontibacter anaerobius]|uniref:Prolyl oligopeptidase family serine peptidase n=1 Tax=Pontibacter anaerobius TaxID=2993940 RepID=A0ABT3RB58_9BACT|nr:prolyl oligopeptidase family serine peptidase [Pontibacter anaerobius]MCX2738607.1 prolyl oligopeptidase family serine peptidase [Pontibacter anaerobius]
MKIYSRSAQLLLSLLMLCLLLSACNRDKPIPPIERMDKYTTTKQYPGKVGDESLEDWKKHLKGIEVAKIKSTLDGKTEPALFYESKSSRKKPLLVVLHSWSSGYLQVPSIPFALWAEKYDWAFIQPNYRGVFEQPEAMASDVAIQDIVDAVDYAKQHADIDTSRIYLVGSSGGAMTALVTASRHPEIWAGVAAWVPVFDIPEWFDFNLYYPHRKYNSQIVAALGGEPLEGTPAEKEGKRRSPSTQIHQAKKVPIFLAHGINDLLVPPSHSIRAFNILANPADTISKEQMDYIVKEQAIPESMQGEATDKYFGKGDPEVVFSRESDNVKLVLYVGVHDMAYNSTLLWLNDQQKKQPQSVNQPQ